MLIFNIFKLRKLYKEARENPGKVAGEELSGALLGLAIVPTILLGAVLLIFFILGFTTFVFGYGPFVLAKVLFYILLPVYFLVLLILWRIVRRMRRYAETLTNNTIDSFGGRS